MKCIRMRAFTVLTRGVIGQGKELCYDSTIHLLNVLSPLNHHSLFTPNTQVTACVNTKLSRTISHVQRMLTI